MLLATPVEGTHYLADLLCGGLVACLALILTPLLIRAISTRGTGSGERDPILAVAAE
jgi:membrane-associated phospholipid phosphatase